jgi:transposase-like protein
LPLDITSRENLRWNWAGESEGANFWLDVLTELKNLCLQEILIACVFGLRGFLEAINTVFPKTEIQHSIIHLIRNTLRYIASKRSKIIYPKKIIPNEFFGLNVTKFLCL